MIQRIIGSIKKHGLFIGINLFFCVIYCLISFVNHYNFKTFALDLGLYTRALHNYAHFRMTTCEMFLGTQENLLCDHFDLFLILFSPLYWVFGNITLLVVQIAAIHFGAYGIYRLALYSSIKKIPSAFISFVFLSCFGIFAAVSFDYHSNLVAVCFLPWFVLFFKQAKFAWSALFFVLILIAKENMAIWMFCVCFGLFFIEKNKQQRKMAALFAGISILFFLFLILYLMPTLSIEKTYNSAKFSVLGATYPEILRSILSHPIDAFILLFKSHLSDESLRFVKMETWCFWFFAGGFLFTLRPAFLLMIIPIMMQKMYHDDFSKWSAGGQYNVEIIPLAAWCLIEAVKDMSFKKQFFLISLTALLSVAATIHLCDNTIAYIDKTSKRFYQKSHYAPYIDHDAVCRAIAKIPKNASVSAQSAFTTRLIDRKNIYQYPIVKDAEYILLCDKGGYPLSHEDLLKNIQNLVSSPEWSYIPISKHIYLFKLKQKNLNLSP